MICVYLNTNYNLDKQSLLLNLYFFSFIHLHHQDLCILRRLVYIRGSFFFVSIVTNVCLKTDKSLKINLSNEVCLQDLLRLLRIIQRKQRHPDKKAFFKHFTCTYLFQFGCSRLEGSTFTRFLKISDITYLRIV